MCLTMALIRPSGRGRAFSGLTVTDQQIPALKPPQQLTNPVCYKTLTLQSITPHDQTLNLGAFRGVTSRAVKEVGI